MHAAYRASNSIQFFSGLVVPCAYLGQMLEREGQIVIRISPKKLVLSRKCPNPNTHIFLSTNGNMYCTCCIQTYKPLFLSTWLGVLFLVWFNNFNWTMGFYWSYTLLFKPLILIASCFQVSPPHRRRGPAISSSVCGRRSQSEFAEHWPTYRHSSECFSVCSSGWCWTWRTYVGMSVLATSCIAIASFPGSNILEREHWKCAGVESLVFFSREKR